jgi:hypothetical protein
LSPGDKKQSFDLMFIKKICPAAFDAFYYTPFVGASGGTDIIWKSFLFSSTIVFQNDYCMFVEFTSKHNNESWLLSNIYAPCTASGKRLFLS